MAARVKPGYSGRLLEQGPARLGLGLDQFADPPLPDHGRRARAGRLVGEEELHVLGARLLAVDAIDGTGLAFDAAGNVQFVGVVKACRGGAILIIEEERDLGGVARRASGRTGKDDVVHARGAHVLVGILAHHPAQGLDEIRLAAAIGPDDAGQPRFDDEIGRLHERLEA